MADETKGYHKDITKIEVNIGGHDIQICDLLSVSAEVELQGYLDALWNDAFRAGVDSVET